MTSPDIRFTGSIPANYDKYLGPVFFEPYALDAAARLPKTAKRVLEVACGTGIVTRRLREAMRPDAHFTATDLSPAMVEYARSRMPGAAGVEFRPADAMALPFPDASFDALVCQFGVMFVPDKAVAFAEMRRVLAPGGTLIFSVWDSLAVNPASRLGARDGREALPGGSAGFHHDPIRLLRCRSDHRPPDRRRLQRHKGRTRREGDAFANGARSRDRIRDRHAARDGHRGAARRCPRNV